MVKKYRVLFHHPLVDATNFEAGMARMGVPVETVARMITKAPVVMRSGLTLEAARRYADAVQEAGGRATITEDGWFDAPAEPASAASIPVFPDVAMCPRCGFKQQLAEWCIKCGFRLSANGEGGRRE